MSDFRGWGSWMTPENRIIEGKNRLKGGGWVGGMGCLKWLKKIEHHLCMIPQLFVYCLAPETYSSNVLCYFVLYIRPLRRNHHPIVLNLLKHHQKKKRGHRAQSLVHSMLSRFKIIGSVVLWTSRKQVLNWDSQQGRQSNVRTLQKKIIGPILFLFYEESLVSFKLNSNLFRLYCAYPCSCT